MKVNPFQLQDGLDKNEVANAPSVVLDGMKFAIPRLAIAQNKIVVGCFKQIMPLIGAFELIAAKSRSEPEAAARSVLTNFPLDEVTFEVICRAVYTALTRAYVISREQFDNIPVGVDELITAVPVVIGQSFAFVKKEGTPTAAPGEATPISETKPSGTESSSIYAEPSAGPGITSNVA